jgi:hypothetical protein
VPFVVDIQAWPPPPAATAAVEEDEGISGD